MGQKNRFRRERRFSVVKGKRIFVKSIEQAISPGCFCRGKDVIFFCPQSEQFLHIFFRYCLHTHLLTLTAHPLYSGIFERGSKAGLVSRFMGASWKWKVENTTFFGTLVVTSALAFMEPRRDVTSTMSLLLTPSLFASSGLISTNGAGASLSRILMRRVMVPV